MYYYVGFLFGEPKIVHSEIVSIVYKLNIRCSDAFCLQYTTWHTVTFYNLFSIS